MLDVWGHHSSSIRMPNKVWWQEGQEGWRREWTQGWNNVFYYINNSSPGCSPEQPPALNSYLNIHDLGNKCDPGAPDAASPSLNGIYYLPNLNRGDGPPATTSVPVDRRRPPQQFCFRTLRPVEK